MFSERNSNYTKTLSFIGIFILLLPFVSYASEKPQIVFAGVTFAGSYSTQNTQFNYLKSKRNKLLDIVNRKIWGTEFKFNLIKAYGPNNKEKIFEELYHPLTLTILITQERYFSDKYQIKINGVPRQIVKNYFDVGISAILFTPAENQDKVEYVIPVIAECIDTGDYNNNQKKADMFYHTFEKGVDILLARLRNLNVRQVNAKVTKIEEAQQLAFINMGKKQGVLKGMFINLPDGGSGQVKSVKSTMAEIVCKKRMPQKGDIIKIGVCKSEEIETYQVKAVKLSSKKAHKLFGQTEFFKVLQAQQYSDYLADRSGVIVMPPKLGSVYTQKAKKSLINAYDLEGNQYEFHIPDAKNQILLDINGLAKKMIKGNNINQIWLYKAWIEMSINNKKKEVSAYVKKNVIVGVTEINDKEVFREVIQQTLAKLAKS